MMVCDWFIEFQSHFGLPSPPDLESQTPFQLRLNPPLSTLIDLLLLRSLPSTQELSFQFSTTIRQTTYVFKIHTQMKSPSNHNIHLPTLSVEPHVRSQPVYRRILSFWTRFVSSCYIQYQKVAVEIENMSLLQEESKKSANDDTDSFCIHSCLCKSFPADFDIASKYTSVSLVDWLETARNLLGALKID